VHVQGSLWVSNLCFAEEGAPDHTKCEQEEHLEEAKRSEGLVRVNERVDDNLVYFAFFH